MPAIIKTYVKWVDVVNKKVGKVVLYLVFVMMALLLFASISRTFFNVPFVWVMEMAQFTMAAYYLLGGGYSMQLKAHVRMDVLYENGATRPGQRWMPPLQAF
jgi:TRAP-type mannitol/chloroaromatic compound transport system permease small subunit